MSQTTNNKDEFSKICSLLSEKTYELRAFNTICDATRQRQNDAVGIAEKVEYMIIVGGKNSANTTRLKELTQKIVPSVHIENAEELTVDELRKYGTIGITAGTSTPDFSIGEVIDFVNRIVGVNNYDGRKQKNDGFENEEILNMEEFYAASFKDLVPGTVVDGVIVKIMGNEVLVDIGYKAEGAVPLNEFHNSDELKEGDEVRVLLESTDDQEGLVKLSKIKADYLEAWGMLEDRFHKDEIIEGFIKKRVKGGFIVNIGVPAFLPASQLDVKLVKDLDAFVSQKIEVKILKMNKKRRNIVVSRRIILEAKMKKLKEDIDNKIQVGAILPGRVKNITNFGAFIDLGGIDGLLHLNDISWKKINHPSDLVSVGDDVMVKVLDYDEKTTGYL